MVMPAGLAMQSCLICDDHAMMREAMMGNVALAWPDAAVSLAVDFPSASVAIAANPELCICDLVMPGASPVDGIAALRAQAPHVPILVVTGSEDDEILLALFQVGIAGFVPKTARSAVIEAAIRVVLAGERYIPARILDLVGQGRPEPQSPPTGSLSLSSRQVEVLRLVAAGQSNKEVARTMMLSPSTVKAHIAAAMAVLGATNRTEAVVHAKRIDAI